MDGVYVNGRQVLRPGDGVVGRWAASGPEAEQCLEYGGETEPTVVAEGERVEVGRQMPTGHAVMPPWTQPIADHHGARYPDLHVNGKVR